MRPLIISAFPGTGKSFLVAGYYDTEAIDLEFSDFSWSSDPDKPDKKVRNQGFPENYVDEIERIIKDETKYKYILISSHESVRKELKKRGIEYTIIYPGVELRDEYLARYVRRGSDQAFITKLYYEWTRWIRSIKELEDAAKIEMKSGQYLADILLYEQVLF